MPVAARLVDAPGGGAETASPQRYIATSHKITLQTPADQLAAQFAAIEAECLKLGCTILNSKQTQEASGRDAEATLSARLPPKAFDGFLRGAISRTKLLEHERSSDDKTAEVIDVEAKIKNLTALRERILELLAKRTGNLKETMEAEKQLSETQATLDTITGLRKALALQTETVKVDIRLLAQTPRDERSWSAPLFSAVHDSGQVLSASLGALILFSVGATPWLLALVFVVFVLRRLYRWRKAKKG